MPDERNKFNKRMITGVFSHWDCIDPLANPGGIWLPPELCQSGPVRLHAVRCHSESFNTQFAQLRYAARLDALHAGPVVLRWTLAPLTFQGAVQVIEQRRLLKAGPQEIYGLLKLRDPRLWWTHDLAIPTCILLPWRYCRMVYSVMLPVLTLVCGTSSYETGFPISMECAFWSRATIMPPVICGLPPLLLNGVSTTCTWYVQAI